MSRARILRIALLTLWAIGAQAAATELAATELAASKLTAAEVVDKNVAARGGLAAWRAVRTLSWSGMLDAGGNNQRSFRAPGMPPPPPVKDPNAQVQLPFSLEMKRGRLSRLEIVVKGKTAVQVYDGTHGWKLRPFLNRNDVEPYSADELKVAGDAADLDGLLIDYAAKGTKIDVEGIEQVEGKPAYALNLTLKSGHVLHVWVDAQSFLEVKVEGTAAPARRPNAQSGDFPARLPASRRPADPVPDGDGGAGRATYREDPDRKGRRQSAAG